MRFESSDLLQKYIHEINMYPQLTKEEEFELGRRIQASIGQPTEKLIRGKMKMVKPEPTDQDAINKLVMANLKFVIKMANRHIGQGVPLLDLINAGNIGMIEAAKRYDPDQKPVRFITYANRWLQKALNGEHDDNGNLVRIPKNQSYDNYKKRKAGEDVNTRPVEIDKPITSDSENTIGDIVLKGNAEAYEQMDTDNNSYQVNVLMSFLTEEEQNVVKLRYGFSGEEDKTNQEIAEELGLTLPQVGRAMRSARAKMKNVNKNLLNA